MNSTPEPGCLTRSARTLLALAVVAGLASGAASAALPSASAVSVARPTDIRDGDVVTGALSLNQPIHIEVALKMRDRAGLDAFIADAARNAVRGVNLPPMTSEQFLARHAPTPAQAQSVADYLAGKGYSNIRIAPNRMLVSADGTARSARDAFATTFVQVRTHDGRLAWANSDDVRIPATLSDRIAAVLGLQNVHIAHVHSHRARSGGSGILVNQAVGHDPTEFPGIYGVGTAATASDVVVGIVTQGSLTQTRADLATFATNEGIPAVSTQTVNTNGTSGDTGGLIEWNLDSQDIVGMTGGVKLLIFYNIPTLFDSDIAADINTIVAANKAKIINVSLGLCETDAQSDGSVTTEDASFATAVAQGQTFSISTGDSGSDECPHDGKSTPVPSWPAASQYVVAVAGTRLLTSSTTGARASESVWSGSGGSPSTFEPQPTWQASFVPSGVTTRDVADVAFDGDPNSGAILIVNGSTGGGANQFGGTSLSAPLFAGLWARVLHVHPTIGFAAPVLYAMASGAFHDITTGNNGSESATAGYDSASGRGSMIIATAITDSNGLGNRAPTANFSSSVTAETAHFTDSSTDPDNNLSTHAWTFGDGGTSAQASPTHLYAAAGTYSVTETVKDQVGASNAKTVSVSATVPQLIHNTGFETGHPAPWMVSPAGALTNNAGVAHAGSWFVALGGGSGAHTDRLTQSATLPSGATKATLSFYLNLSTAETGGVSHDHMSVQVLSSDGGTVLATLGTYSNLDPTGGYVLKSLDMSAFLGQSVQVRFLGVNDATLPTTWDIDDVMLKIR